MRKLLALGLIPLGWLAACGGGGGYGGGGGGGGGQMIATPGAPNVETLTVDAGPPALVVPAINIAYVSVQVCQPGTSTCQTIDHIQVDTGSIGLRLISSVLTIALPAETSAGTPLAECFQFVANTTIWGPLAVADIKLPISGESAANVGVQIIADTNSPYSGHTPGDCTGALADNVALFGANGILGVGPFIDDCNSVGPCPIPSGPQGVIYYSCPSPSTCGDTAAALAQQVPNPATLFADNNGVIIELPAIGSAGCSNASCSGSLVFGIGTQTNNGLGTAKVLPADPSSGYITATYKGVAYVNGYLDAGSNGNFFTDGALTQCVSPSPNVGFYCQNPATSEMATLQGSSATTLTGSFSVGDADTIPASYTAFPDLAGTNADPKGFDLGLSFFYGHNIFTAIEMSSAAGAPYFAY